MTASADAEAFMAGLPKAELHQAMLGKSLMATVNSDGPAYFAA